MKAYLKTIQNIQYSTKVDTMLSTSHSQGEMTAVNFTVYRREEGEKVEYKNWSFNIYNFFSQEFNDKTILKIKNRIRENELDI